MYVFPKEEFFQTSEDTNSPKQTLNITQENSQMHWKGFSKFFIVFQTVNEENVLFCFRVRKDFKYCYLYDRITRDVNLLKNK